ncbi:M12 family metallo-peptidase [Methylomagnum sp.]
MGLSTLLGFANMAALASDLTPPGNLLRDPTPTELSGPSATAGPEIVPPKVKQGRDRSVMIDAPKLRGDRISLNLFGDAALVGERDRVVEDEPGRSVWIGHLQGEPTSEVVLAFRDQALSGTVKRENGDLYEIAYQGNGLHRVRQLDQVKVPAHSHPVAAGAKSGVSPASSPAPATTAAATPTTTIVDLMVVYTPRARTNAGGVTGIKARIDNAVAAANQAYINSLIDMRLRLVYTAEVPYTETGNMSRTLYDLQKSNDGKMDAVHQWRNKYGADQVVLISADANYCGIGYQMSLLSAGFASYAFAVAHDDSRYACLSNQTLAHELGHNQGNAHDRANSTTPGIYPYSYGHRLCQAGGFRTVMAYPCSGANTVSYFANPNLKLNGSALGIDPAQNAASSAADAWSMMNARATVANWRASVNTTTTSGAPVKAAPAAPANLAALPVAGDQISLDWLDVADNEAGFRVEYSLDGSEWREIANLGPNATHFSHTGLSPATRYVYRVAAYNGAGGSDSTNVVSVATPAQTKPVGTDTVAPVVRIASPGNNTQVAEQAGIVATGSDDGGIQSLKLYVDGRLKAAANGAMLTYRWNTQGVAPGIHALEVVALDNAGNTGKAVIQVRK